MFEADDIRNALNELAQRLDAATIPAGIRVIGGAALALAYYDRASTADIDALLHPKDDILHVARHLATEHGWPPNWLNDDARLFMSHHETASDWTIIAQVGATTIRVASAPLLLAMKLRAGRGRRDDRDIDVLLETCAVATLDDVDAIYEHYYPDDPMSARARRQAEAWVAARAQDRGPSDTV